MAEAFSNKVARAAGIVTTMTGGAIGITTNLITGISTTNVAVNDLVDNSNYILGTKVSSVGASQVICDRDSTNTAAATAQSVKFLGVTTAYTSPAGKVNTIEYVNIQTLGDAADFGDLSVVDGRGGGRGFSNGHGGLG